MKDFDRMPIELREIINGFKIIEVIEGRIGDKIIKLANSNNEILYLKTSDTLLTQNEMFNEFEILNWLDSEKLNTPNPLFFKKEVNKSYMLLSNLPGINAHEITDKFEKDAIVRLSAEALKKIHETEFSTIPSAYRNCLDVELDEVCDYVRNDRIDIEGFKNANDNKTPKECLEYLLDKRSMFNADVFTHGDYCLPNVLIVDKCDYGFVDWAQAGGGDIYRDIAPMVKSINRNFGEAYSEKFFEYYGIDEDKINFEKIDFYNLMDQFYYCKK